MRAIGQTLLLELEAEIGRDPNPLHAWDAAAVARQFGLERPGWVDDLLIEDNLDHIQELREESRAGKPIPREAEAVGKALGFGVKGPGRGGWFSRANLGDRDRRVYIEVSRALETEKKLDFAYDVAATKLKASRSAIVRAYLRVKRQTGELGPSSKSDRKVS
jgi:hypothetical protein